jgi:divalent metal cation (Fe/Co/Zn/Cd) transporter
MPADDSGGGTTVQFGNNLDRDQQPYHLFEAVRLPDDGVTDPVRRNDPFHDRRHQPGSSQGWRGEVSPETTRKHPFGFGKEKYFWALVSSISVLFLGCGASIRHAIEALRHPEPGEPFSALVIGLLVLAGLLEGYTFHFAWREIGGWQGLKGARTNTTVLAVLLEDAVALLGIALTLFVGLWSVIVGPAPTMDAWISIFIGVLLGAMAVALARLNKEMLIDVADTGLDAEIERLILARAGIRIKVASTMIDGDRCLLYVQVAQPDIPADLTFAKVTEAGNLLKKHVSASMGKTIDHVFWRFSPVADTDKQS